MARHWHVVVNTPGYLPEGDPTLCERWEDAALAVEWEVANLLDSQEHDEPDPYEVGEGTPQDGFVRLTTRRPYGLDIVVAAIACDDCCEAFAP